MKVLVAEAERVKTAKATAGTVGGTKGGGGAGGSGRDPLEGNDPVAAYGHEFRGDIQYGMGETDGRHGTQEKDRENETEGMEGDSGQEDKADREEEGGAEQDDEEEEDEDGNEDDSEEGDDESGSGDNSEEDVYTGDGEEADAEMADDFVDLVDEGADDGTDGAKGNKRKRVGGRKRNKGAAGKGNGSTAKAHMEVQHKHHYAIWLRKFNAGEIGPDDYFSEGGYGQGDEIPDGKLEWEGSATWPAPPPVGVPGKSGQQRLTKYFPERFDKDVLQQAMVEWVVATDQAFSVVEHPTFHRMMMAANPACAEEKVIPSRSTLACQILRLADLAQTKLNEELLADGSGAVALTHDIWTGENHWSYMAVTGHSISKDCELRRVTLKFRALPGEHTSKKIVQVLEDVVKEWDLEGQCSVVTSDNASSNVVAMEYLCRGGMSDRQPPLFFSGMHVRPSPCSRCLDHICNLAVQLALKSVLDINEPLGLLRDLASFIGYSPKRTTAFELEQRVQNAKAKLLRLRQDNEVRCGATYLMLERALRLKHAIINYIRHTEGMTAKDAARLQQLTLSETQWLALEELRDFLQPFRTVTLAVEGSSYPTISRVDPQFNELLDSIERLRDREEGSGSHHVAAAQILELVRAKVPPYKEKVVAARRMRGGTGGGGAGRGRGETGSGGASSSGRKGGVGGSKGGKGSTTDAFDGAVGDKMGLVARLAAFRSRQ
ncbi:unnamed protein product [Closterium sp. Naga37s-1]|nr:unnamed protein product [Closterium sp. Naga37s-1]